MTEAKRIADEQAMKTPPTLTHVVKTDEQLVCHLELQIQKPAPGTHQEDVPGGWCLS